MEEMTSFNSEFSEFDLQQLEERLETDPLVTGGLVDFDATLSDSTRCVLYCPHLTSCPELH